MNKLKNDFIKIFYRSRSGEIGTFQVAVILIASGLLLLTTLTSKMERDYLQEQNEKILCSKEYVNSLKKFKRFISSTNKLIATAKLGKITSIMVPGLGAVAVANNKALTALKLSQEVAHKTFLMKQLIQQRECTILNGNALSPLKSDSGVITRNKLEQAEFKPSIDFEYIGRKFTTQVKVKIDSFPTKGSVWIYLKDKKGVWSLTSSLPFSSSLSL